MKISSFYEFKKDSCRGLYMRKYGMYGLADIHKHIGRSGLVGPNHLLVASKLERSFRGKITVKEENFLQPRLGKNMGFRYISSETSTL